VICDDHFDHGFCAPIRVCGANGAVFWNGYHVGYSSRIAVHCGRRGEDDIWDIVFGHATEEGDRAANIDAVVFERDFGRFADSLGNV
jgi:hypothetical protein